MNSQEVLNYIDNLLYSQIGEHLDSLQTSILRGVFDHQKYAQIAKECNCTEGHVRDEAYQLWQKLSEVLNQNLNKANFCAAMERIIIRNSQFQIVGNPIQIGSIKNINLCPSTSQTDISDNSNRSQVEDLDLDNLIGKESLNAVENVKKRAKLEIVSNLKKLGLTSEQIAQALALSLDEVENV
jgi:hypothetical protein